MEKMVATIVQREYNKHMNKIALFLLTVSLIGCGRRQGPPGQNGLDGAAGKDGVSPSIEYSIVDVVDPCGDAPGKYDELLLVLGNGTLVASFSDSSSGLNTRLVEIPDGTYNTTDNTGCTFTVSTAGSTRHVTWSGGGKSWDI